jgi:hypothetical protein
MLYYVDHPWDNTCINDFAQQSKDFVLPVNYITEWDPLTLTKIEILKSGHV